MKALSTEIQALSDALQRDTELLNQLRDSGELFKARYHPLMQQCHEENALLLEQFLEKYGWPLPSEYGQAHETAWMIAIHAISRPDLLKRVLKIFEDNNIKDGCYARLYDRIELYQGRKQKYGTQFFTSKYGWYVRDLADPTHVDERRKEVNLPPLSVALEECKEFHSGITDEDEDKFEQEFTAWLQKAGWRK